MPDNDLQGYLKSLPTEDSTRADAWDAFNGAKDQNDFQQRVGKLGIPDDAKADLWDAKYGNKQLGVYKPPQAVTPPTQTPATPQPDAFSRLWGWANKPLNIGHLRETIAQQKADSESAPSLEDANHPALTAVRKGLEGFGADAAKILLTPLSVGLAATGGAGALPGAVGKVAQGVGALTGGAFAASGAVDVVTPKKPEESNLEYGQRLAQGGAMVLGGAAGEAKSLQENKLSPPSESSPTSPSPSASTIPDAQTRKAQALGTPAGPSVSKIVHVDPAMADALHKWNQTPLPGKRVIIRNGEMKLANTNPKVAGFEYQNFEDANGNPTVDTKVSETPTEGKVPVELSTISGGRATSAPGHYLSNQIVGEMPSTEAVAPPAAPEAKAEAQPPIEVAATPPAATENVLPKTAEKPSSKLVDSRAVIAKAKAQILVDKVVIPAEPAKGIEEVKLPTTETPLEESPVANLGKPQAKPLSTGSPELEDKLRPMLGQLIRTAQLRTGEQASHAIDIAMRETRDPDGAIPTNVAAQVSKILGGEDVGKNLTPDQMSRLEQRRGATLGTEPQLQIFSDAQADRLRTEGGRLPNGGRTTPEEEEDSLYKSQVRALELINDPNISESFKNRLNDVIQSGKSFRLTQPENEPYLKYPGPVDLPAEHPEAPFAPKALGSDIAPINLKNLTAALGKQPRDLFLRTSKSSPHVPSEDLAQLEAMKRGSEPENSPSQAQLTDLIGTPESNPHGMSVGDIDTSAKAGSDVAEFERSLKQKALDSFQAKTLGAAKGLIGEIEKAGGVSSGLRAQLDALSPSVKRLLPQELFGEKSTEATTGAEGKTSAGKESSTTAGATKETTTKPPTRRPTPYEGIRTTGLEDELLQKYLNVGPKIDLIQKSVAEAVPVGQRQKFYKNALEIFAKSKYAEDDFSLAKGIDAVRSQEIKPDKSGGLGLAYGKPQRPYTPEQALAINQDVAHNQLTRWEAMSQSELIKKKAGLWADSLQDRIDATVPFSTDPDIYQRQLEAHNELLERVNSLKAAVGRSDNLHDSLVDMWKNWTGKGLDAQVREFSGRTLREVGGKMDRDNAIIRQGFDHLERFMNELPIHDQDHFWDNMTRGLAQSSDAFHPIDSDYVAKWEAKNGPVLDPNEVASRLRTVMDAARERVTATSGNLQNFFVNYMPGLWENQAKGKSFSDSWVGNRNFQGDTNFLKQKMYEYYSDALKAGLQPTTTNPIRAAMMITEQMNRYSMAHEYKNAMIDGGIVHFYQGEETPPTGWEKLDDKLFSNIGGGSYWAPPAAARQFNNFISQGLRGKWKVPYTNFSLFDALKSTNSLANQFQLGLSAFHGVETILNSGFTTMAVGLRRSLQGIKIGDAPMFAKGILDGIKGGSFIIPAAEDVWNGTKGLLEYRDPGSTKSLEYAQLANDLEAARANVLQDPKFHLATMDRFRKNYELAGDALLPPSTRAVAGVKASLDLLRAGVETTAWPLMNYFVPRVKLGAFYKMSQQIHEQYEGQPAEVINREMQKAWDSVDNRFGQVSYQNMFMNKTVQDLATLAVRSPGWNIGTIREVGGGMLDLAKSVSDASKGKGFNVSNRTAYTGAMVLGTMTVNAIYHYMHTGQMAQGVDFFFPKDGTKTVQGEDNRVYPKTYVYDFVNLYHDPFHTIEHKAAPDISTLADIVLNQDYYHKTIRDPGSSPAAQAASTLAYMAHQFVPFSFGNLQESKLRNQSSNWESFAGILPAPRWVGRTSAENLAYSYYLNTKATGGQSPAMLDRQRQFVELRNKVASGQVTPDQIQAAVEAGKIQPGAIKHLYDSLSKPQLLTWVNEVRDPEQLWNIWKVASPEEKKTLLPVVVSRISKELSGKEQEDKLNEIQSYSDTLK
jgi:hypothetical protein